MPTLMERIPDAFKPLAALGIGAFVLVFLALFHGAGLHWIMVRQTSGERRLRVGPPHLIAASFLFGSSVFLMLDLHIVEVLAWAFALNCMGFIVRSYDAIYYCANCYTTLGMGKVDVGEHWRNISPIIGISGLFTFAWTTSALVDVVASNRRLIDQLVVEREREMHMRFALRRKEWAALKAERDVEKGEKEKTKAAASGSSFIQRLSIWWEERRRVVVLRRKKVSELEDLHRQERLKERELGPTLPNSSSEHKQQE